MRVIRATVFTIALAMLPAANAHAGDEPVVVWFAMPPDEVSEVIANICADRGAMVVEQDRSHVLCSQVTSGLKGALTQFLIGNAYSTTPEVKVRFALLKNGSSTRVLAEQWVETQMAFGQLRREPVMGRKNIDRLRAALIGEGGQLTRPLETPQRSEQADPLPGVGPSATAPNESEKPIAKPPEVVKEPTARRRNPDYLGPHVVCVTCRD